MAKGETAEKRAYFIRMIIPQDVDEHSTNEQHLYSYRCDICHFATSALDMMVLHIKDHMFRCSLCDFTTSMQHKLLKHKAETHGIKRPLFYDFMEVDFADATSKTSGHKELQPKLLHSFRFHVPVKEKFLLKPLTSAENLHLASPFAHSNKTINLLNFQQCKEEKHLVSHINCQKQFIQPCSVSSDQPRIKPTLMTKALKILSSYLDVGLEPNIETCNIEYVNICEDLDEKPCHNHFYANVQEFHTQPFQLNIIGQQSVVLANARRSTQPRVMLESAVENSAVCKQKVVPLELVQYIPRDIINKPKVSVPVRRSWRRSNSSSGKASIVSDIVVLEAPSKSGLCCNYFLPAKHCISLKFRLCLCVKILHHVNFQQKQNVYCVGMQPLNSL